MNKKWKLSIHYTARHQACWLVNEHVKQMLLMAEQHRYDSIDMTAKIWRNRCDEYLTWICRLPHWSCCDAAGSQGLKWRIFSDWEGSRRDDGASMHPTYPVPTRSRNSDRRATAWFDPTARNNDSRWYDSTIQSIYWILDYYKLQIIRKRKSVKIRRWKYPSAIHPELIWDIVEWEREDIFDT